MKVTIKFLQYPDCEYDEVSFSDVESTYGDGGYFTVLLEDGVTSSFPRENIFRIDEDQNDSE